MRYEILSKEEFDKYDIKSAYEQFMDKNPEQQADYNSIIHQHIIQDLILSGLPPDAIIHTVKNILNQIQKTIKNS